MQPAKNETKTYDLKVEKVIQKSPAEVFRAIGEGRLFLNCSASNESIKIDFRVGGKYHIDFASYPKSNQGEFLEIVPDRKIVFTWCQVPGVNPIPDTTVTIEMRDQGGKTHLTLTHVGFTDSETREKHQGGWTGGLNDLSNEITDGRLRFMRKYPVPVQKLYELCKTPTSFFGLMSDTQKGKADFKVGGEYRFPTEKGEISGKFLEIVTDQKIIFSWTSTGCGVAENTKVTLLFDTEENNQSWLELIHEGLTTDAQQKSHREGWDWILSRLAR